VGKTQRQYPTDSWNNPYDLCPDVWNSNLLHKHGNFHSTEEQVFLQGVFSLPALSDTDSTEFNNELAVELGLMMIGLVVLSLGVCVLAIQVAMINFRIGETLSKGTSKSSNAGSREADKHKKNFLHISEHKSSAVPHDEFLPGPPVNEVIVKRLDVRYDTVSEYNKTDDDVNVIMNQQLFSFANNGRKERKRASQEQRLSAKVDALQLRKVSKVKLSNSRKTSRNPSLIKLSSRM